MKFGLNPIKVPIEARISKIATGIHYVSKGVNNVDDLRLGVVTFSKFLIICIYNCGFFTKFQRN